MMFSMLCARGYLPLGAALLYCGCASVPAPVAPPDQYVMPPGREPAPLTLRPDRMLLTMADPDVDEHLLANVMPGNGGDWRWTGPHPRIRINVRAEKTLMFFMRFAISEATLRDTGPVRIAIRINGMEVARQSYNTAGHFDLRSRVPPAVLARANPAIIQVDVDPPWISPADYAALGVLLNTIGFEEAAA